MKDLKQVGTVQDLWGQMERIIPSVTGIPFFHLHIAHGLPQKDAGHQSRAGSEQK